MASFGPSEIQALKAFVAELKRNRKSDICVSCGCALVTLIAQTVLPFPRMDPVVKSSLKTTRSLFHIACVMQLKSCIRNSSSFSRITSYLWAQLWYERLVSI